MTSTEFKSGLKEIKEYLKGITLSVSSKYCTQPFYTLKDFGNEILKHESYGHSFSITTVWTNDGRKSARTFADLIQLFKNYQVDGVRFNAYKDEVYDECSFIRSFGSLD
jgi:hypothetical protein